jgi:uncharacterized protein
MKNIVILHGFNSGPGEKSQLAQKWLERNDLSDAVQLISPQLSHSPKQAVDELKERLLGKERDTLVIGTSLGGFYAAYLFCVLESKPFHTALVNPSWRPAETLSIHLNQKLINYKTAEEWVFTTSMHRELENLQEELHHKFRNLSDNQISVHLADQDELLDFTEMKNYFTLHKRAVPHYVYSTNHRFECMDELMDNCKQVMMEFLTDSKSHLL